MLLHQGILLENEISTAERRAACEGLGLLARIGNDTFTARMVCLLTVTVPAFTFFLLLLYMFCVSFLICYFDRNTKLFPLSLVFFKYSFCLVKIEDVFGSLF